MNITLTTHIEGMEDIEEDQIKDFEYDLRESTKTLLFLMGVDFKDIDFQFSYNGGFIHNE